MATFSALRNPWQPLLDPQWTSDLCPADLCPISGFGSINAWPVAVNPKSRPGNSPIVTEFQVVILFSISEAVRYFTLRVEESACDRPEAAATEKAILYLHQVMWLAWLGGRSSGSRLEKHAVKSLFSTC
jgi:hypothetical protein